jgi:hypothetical protein
MMEHIGRRFERLMLAAAPIAAVTLLAVYLELGSDRQDKLIAARCYEKIVEVISRPDVQSQLGDAWSYGHRMSHAGDPEGYLRVVRIVLSKHDDILSPVCPDLSIPTAGPIATNSIFTMFGPGDVPAIFNQYAEGARASIPPSLGVHFPDSSSIDVFGTAVKIDLHVALWLLLSLLAGVFIIWTGSLLTTRRVELHHSVRSNQGLHFYPHALNNFPFAASPFDTQRPSQPRRSGLLCCYRLAIWLLVAGVPVGLFTFAWSHLLLRGYVVPLWGPNDRASVSSWANWMSVATAVIPAVWLVRKAAAVERIGLQYTQD